MPKLTSNHTALNLLVASLLTACYGTEQSDTEEHLGVSESPLVDEMTNGSAAITYAAREYYRNPDISVNQWAEASLSNTHCNGVMIGPNVFLSAGHCGANASDTVTFRTYRNGSFSQSDSETFNCGYLLQSFPDTDGILFYCAPNAAGENPGDKYGYVDFDLNQPTIGQNVYSISANPNVDGAVALDARMYVTGQVVGMNNDWYVPDAIPGSGYSMNLWSEPGMSGSPHFNAANHKMIIAPLSVGASWFRGSNSMANLLYWGVADPAVSNSINHAQISALGLTSDSYYGWVDSNIDWEFDVQHDLERLNGEKRRGWYWLGAESPRRNALWDAIDFTTFDPDNRWIRINKTSGTGYSDAVVHRKLNLASGVYRVSFMTFTQSATNASALWASLKSGSTYIGGQYFTTTVGAGWQMNTIKITTSASNAEFVLGARGTADILVSALSIVKQGAVMDFDSFDKRSNWRNDIDGSRAQVVPDGRTTGTPNWAVRISPQGSSGFPVRNRQLALVKGRKYQICFAARKETSAAAQGEIRVLSAGTSIMSQTFTPSSTWGNHCAGSFTPTTHDNNVQMRVVSGSSAILVDDMTFTEF